MIATTTLIASFVSLGASIGIKVLRSKMRSGVSLGALQARLFGKAGSAPQAKASRPEPTASAQKPRTPRSFRTFATAPDLVLIITPKDSEKFAEIARAEIAGSEALGHTLVIGLNSVPNSKDGWVMVPVQGSSQRHILSSGAEETAFHLRRSVALAFTTKNFEAIDRELAADGFPSMEGKDGPAGMRILDWPREEMFQSTGIVLRTDAIRDAAVAAAIAELPRPPSSQPTDPDLVKAPGQRYSPRGQAVVEEMRAVMGHPEPYVPPRDAPCVFPNSDRITPVGFTAERGAQRLTDGDLPSHLRHLVGKTLKELTPAQAHALADYRRAANAVREEQRYAARMGLAGGARPAGAASANPAKSAPSTAPLAGGLSATDAGDFISRLVNGDA